jgi:hypothetical protein
MTDFPKQHPSHTDQSPPGARPDDEHCPLDFDYLRDQVVGIDAPFETPFGSRSMLYGDYTASGRCLAFVESYLMHVQRNYANTHTEDDVSGRSMTQLLHEAEASIKRAVNAGPHGRLIAVGAGSTAAIDKFQQIVGVQIPPATLQLLREMIRNTHGEEGEDALTQLLAAQRPVIFVGAYEHHSNEVTWRQGLCEAVEVRLGPDRWLGSGASRGAAPGPSLRESQEDRVVFGGLQRDGHPHAGAGDREAAARAWRAGLLRLRGERALRRD